MNAAPAQDLNPPAAASSGPALALSLLAHALLVLALAWGVNWSRTDPTVAFSAEIWAPVAERAAPAATAPEVSPKPTPPPPQEQPAPPPPPPPARVQQEARDADLALEKRRKEKQKAEEKAEKQAKEKAQKDKAEKERVEKDRKEKEDKQREKAKEEARKEQDRKEAAESEKRRQEQLRRIQGQASSTTATGTPGATGAPESKGTAQRSAAPSSSYGGKIVQLIKDNTKFTDPNSGRPSVVVLVRTSPQGKIDLKELKIISPSGNQAFDDAVLRGIQKMESVPKDIDGRVPEVLLREGLELKVTL
jgi:colicin import membrane protein